MQSGQNRHRAATSATDWCIQDKHYDRAMSEVFFEELGIPEPDVNLGCGGGTQAEQTASIMLAFERELLANPCDCVLVVGDVTSTMACTLVAKN